MVGAVAEADLVEQLERTLSRATRPAPASPRRSRLPISVGMRLNCWKTKPNERSRSTASSWSGRLARSRPSKTTPPALGRSSAPSSCRSVVLPEPLGPSSATNSPAAISRSMPSSARTVACPRWKNLRDAAQLVERRGHQSTCLSASAGRSRAARSAPAAPAMRPPRTASENPMSRIGRPIGAFRETDRVAVRGGADAETQKVAAAGRRCSRRATARRHRSRAAASTPSPTPEETAEHALRERLACDLPDDEPLRPAERLEGAELADTLPDRRQRQQRREQERGDRSDDREDDAEVLREVRGVDERAADLVGDLLRARDLSLRQRRLDRLLHLADRRARRGSNEDDVGEPLLARELLQLLERQVDIGALTTERRTDEPDDRERRAVQIELRADLQAVLRRVGRRRRAPRDRRRRRGSGPSSPATR